MGDFRSSSRWIKLTAAVKERDGAVCVFCGATEDITVDHIKSAKNYPDLIWDMDNLRVLCRPCNSRKGTKELQRVTWFNRKYLENVA